MTPNPITDGTSQPLTAAGPVAPSTGLDISGLSGDYMLQIDVLDLHCASGTPKARVIIEDTVNAFTASIPVCELNLVGPIVAGAPVTQTWRSDRAPSLRLGTASAKLRANVAGLDGTTPSITLRVTLHN